MRKLHNLSHLNLLPTNSWSSECPRIGFHNFLIFVYLREIVSDKKFCPLQINFFFLFTKKKSRTIAQFLSFLHTKKDEKIEPKPKGIYRRCPRVKELSRCSIPALSLKFFVFVSTFARSLSRAFVFEEDQTRIKLVRLRNNLRRCRKLSAKGKVDHPRSKNNENENYCKDSRG